MIYHKRRCANCHAWFSRELLLCPLCGQEWRKSRQSDICRSCGARIEPTDDPCPYCGASRRAGIAQGVPRLGSALMSIFIVALGAVLVWWIIPFGAQVGEQAPPGPTPTPRRPTAVSLAEILPSPTAAAAPIPTALPSLAPTEALLHALDAELPTPDPAEDHAATPTLPLPMATPTPTGTPEPPTATPLDPTVAPSETPTAGAVASPRVHVVQQGDVLGRLAVLYGVSAAAIAEANGITLTTILSLGQELVIPGVQGEPAPEEPTPIPTILAPTILTQPTAGPPAHVVQQGDTLNAIARRYGVTAAALAEANGITLTSVLSLGQTLVLPGAAPVATPAPPTAIPTPTPEATQAPGGAPEVQRTVRPTETPTPTPMPLRHAVAQGDTLGALALRYGVAAARIAEANGITLTTILRLGQELLIPDSTVEPTAAATATPEATPTPTSTPSPTPTNVPIRTPVAALLYRAPRLLTPVSGAILRGDQSQPALQWTSVGILAEDEWYQVSLWTPESRGAPVETLTKATSWRVPAELYPEGRRESRFEWQVRVIRVLDVAPGRVAQSPPTSIYWFTWR